MTRNVIIFNLFMDRYKLLSSKLKKSKQTNEVTSIQKMLTCLTAGTLESILSSQSKSHSLGRKVSQRSIDTFKSCCLGTIDGGKDAFVEIYDRGVQRPGTHDEDFKMIGNIDLWFVVQ